MGLFILAVQKMKRLITFIIVVLLLPTLFGCVRYTENTLRRNRDFLRFSLGDYVVVSEVDHKYRGPAPGYIDWKSWQVQYTRESGEEITFNFDNRARQGFGWWVVHHASEIGSDALVNGIASSYFPPEVWGSRGLQLQPLIFPPFGLNLPEDRLDNTPENDAISRALDLQNGLQLYSVTPQELVTDWGFRLDISLSYSLYLEYASPEDDEDVAEVIERFKAMTRTLADYLDLEQVTLRFSLPPSEEFRESWEDVQFWGYYDRQTDIFVTKTSRELREEREEYRAQENASHSEIQREEDQVVVGVELWELREVLEIKAYRR